MIVDDWFMFSLLPDTCGPVILTKKAVRQPSRPSEYSFAHIILDYARLRETPFIMHLWTRSEAA